MHNNNEKMIGEFYKCIKYLFKLEYPKFEKIGLHPGQPQLLKALYLKGAKSQKELANMLLISCPTTAMMIKRMEKQGFIDKEQDKNDLRKSIIRINDKGIKVLEEFKEIEEELEQNFRSVLEQDEQETLIRLLKKLNASFYNKYNNCLEGDD